MIRRNHIFIMVLCAFLLLTGGFGNAHAQIEEGSDDEALLAMVFAFAERDPEMKEQLEAFKALSEPERVAVLDKARSSFNCLKITLRVRSVVRESVGEDFGVLLWVDEKELFPEVITGLTQLTHSSETGMKFKAAFQSLPQGLKLDPHVTGSSESFARYQITEAKALVFFKEELAKVGLLDKTFELVTPEMEDLFSEAGINTARRVMDFEGEEGVEELEGLTVFAEPLEDDPKPISLHYDALLTPSGAIVKIENIEPITIQPYLHRFIFERKSYIAVQSGNYAIGYAEEVEFKIRSNSKKELGEKLLERDISNILFDEANFKFADPGDLVYARKKENGCTLEYIWEVSSSAIAIRAAKPLQYIPESIKEVNKVCSDADPSEITSDFEILASTDLEELALATQQQYEANYPKDVERFSTLLKELIIKGEFHAVDALVKEPKDLVLMHERLKAYSNAFKNHYNDQRKIFIISGEISYFLSQPDWQNFVTDVIASVPGFNKTKDRLICIPYVTNEVAVKYETGKFVSKSLYYVFPGQSFHTIPTAFNSVRQYFTDIYIQVPKPMIRYNYLLKLDGTIEYVQLSTKANEYDKGIGRDRIYDVELYVDKEINTSMGYHQSKRKIKEAGANAGLVASLKRANLSVTERYFTLINNEDREADFDNTINYSNLNLKESYIEGFHQAYVMNELVELYPELSRSGFIQRQDIPDNYLYEVPDRVLEVIDFLSLAASPIGGDVVFDAIGATYLVTRGDYGGASIYSASVFLPFTNGATTKALVKYSDDMLKNIRLANPKGKRKDLLKSVFKSKDDKKIAKLVDDPNLAPATNNPHFLAEVDFLDETSANRLLNDFVDNSDFGAYLASNNLVDAWGIVKNTGFDDLARNTDVLEEVSKLGTKTLDGIPLDVAKLFDNGLGKTLGKVSDVDKTKILSRINEWDASKVDDLARRLGKTDYAGLVDELADPELFDLYDKIVRDPFNATDLANEGGSALWEKIGKSTFFNEVTTAGKNFEKYVVQNLGTMRSKILSKYPNLDINDYEIFTQVQMKTGLGDEYFVADMVLVKRQTKTVQGVDVQVLDYENAVVLETKLSSGTNLTTPQGNALTKVKSSENTFDVRSVSKQSSGGFSIGNSDNLKVSDFVKVSSNGQGGVIDNVVSLK